MTNQKIWQTAIATLSTALTVTLTQLAVLAQEYKFTVENNTRVTITQILVSEDGSNWGYFDIGSGIKPGETATLVWDKSTNNESCTQEIKAVYADGTEAAPASFNFCEETNLVFNP